MTCTLNTNRIEQVNTLCIASKCIVPGMENVMADRLREARAKSGYDSAVDAAEAFGWQVSGYRHHENGTRPFGVEQAKRYGRAFRVNPGWLLALDKIEAAPLSTSRDRIVEVTGAVAAGVWRETSEWPQSERYEIVVGPTPFPRARRFGLETRGLSMDLVFPPGTILDCVSIFDLSVAPETGDFVIVERIRVDGMRELTVKEYLRESTGRTWLVPRSTAPEFQAPIEIGMPDRDHDNDESVRVIAYVIGSYQPRTSRLLRAANSNKY